jgi:hypothetical protein
MSSSFSEVQMYVEVVFQCSIEVYVVMFLIIAKRSAFPKATSHSSELQGIFAQLSSKMEFLYV